MDLTLRADASERLGTGHVLRSLALAQAWMRAGGTATFAMSACPQSLCERLRAENAAVVSIRAERASRDDARETAQRAAESGARWVALDGCDFDAGCQAELRARGLRVLVIDDEARAETFAADVLLNHNACATADLYRQKSGRARLALGSRYALLRGEFAPWRLWRREIPDRARRILIMIGDGGDAAFDILRGIDLLENPSLELQLAIDSPSPHREELEQEARRRGARFAVDARNMPELMAWADIAISATASAAWELAYMGTPSLMLTRHGERELSAECLRERGAAQTLERADSSDPERLAGVLARWIGDARARATISRAGRRMLDGRGASRVVELLREAA